MKIYNYISILSFCILLNLAATAQQINLSQNSHFNILNENIAFAGNYNATHFSANYSKLWNITGAPESFNFSAHTPFKKRKLGMGIMANRTTIGAHEEVNIKGVFAYKLLLSKGKRISLGLSGGFRQYNFKSSDLIVLDLDNETYNFTGLNSTVLNVDFGAIYTDNKNYFGIEVNQITSSDWNLNSTDKSKQVPHFKLVAGHVFPLKNKDFIRVSAHARTDINFQIQSDVLASYFYQNKIWIGGGVRTNYGLLAQLEINISKRLHIGYIAGIPLSSSVTNFSQSHSIFLGYMLPSNKTKAPSLRQY